MNIGSDVQYKPGEVGASGHYKIKRNIMYKFFNEPVDALDLRLTKAEATLTVVSDPWLVKAEKEDSLSNHSSEVNGPLDFSEVKALYNEEKVSSSNESDDWDTDPADHNDNYYDNDDDNSNRDQGSDIQFINARSLRSFRAQRHRSHPYHHRQSSSPNTFRTPSVIKQHISSCSSFNCFEKCQRQPVSNLSCHPNCQISNPRLEWPLTTDDPIPESLSLKREEEDEDDDMARKINFTEENYSKYSDNNTLHLIGNNKLINSSLDTSQTSSPPPSSFHRRHLEENNYFSVPPSSHYLARSYELLNENYEQDKHTTAANFKRTNSVIVRNKPEEYKHYPPPPTCRQLPSPPPSAPPPPPRSPRPADSQTEWYNNIQMLRERIAYQLHHQKLHPGSHFGPAPDYPYVSYQSLLNNYLPIKTEKEDLTTYHTPTLFNPFFSKSSKDETLSHPYTRPMMTRPPSRDLYKNVSSSESMYESSKCGLNSAYYFDPHSRNKRGRPRKHAPKVPLPPLYVFIRNLLHNTSYNPRVVSWVDEVAGCFKVTNTTEFAKTWGRMKSNRSEEMNYEKMSRAMRYHYGSERHGRKGHLAMVKEKRLFYKFGELAVNWRVGDMKNKIEPCNVHSLCKTSLCLWTKE